MPGVRWWVGCVLLGAASTAAAATPVCNFDDPALLTLETEPRAPGRPLMESQQVSRCGELVASDDGQVRLWGSEERQDVENGRYHRGRRVVQWRDANGTVRSRVAAPELNLDTQVDQIAPLPGAPGRYLFLGYSHASSRPLRWAQVLELGDRVRQVPDAFGAGVAALLISGVWPEGATKLRHTPLARGTLQYVAASRELRFVRRSEDGAPLAEGPVAVLGKSAFAAVKRLPAGLSFERSWAQPPARSSAPARIEVEVAQGTIYRTQPEVLLGRTARALVVSEPGKKYCAGEVAANPPELDATAPPDWPLVIWPLEKVLAVCAAGKTGVVASEKKLVCADGSVTREVLAKPWSLTVKCVDEGNSADEVRPSAGELDTWWRDGEVRAATRWTLPDWSGLVFPRPWRIVGTLYDAAGRPVQELEEPSAVVDRPGTYELEPTLYFFDGKVTGRRVRVSVDPYVSPP